MTRWEYRRTWNHLRKSLRQPFFISVQILSLTIIVLIIWLLWVFLFLLPVSLRGSLYWLIINSELIGTNTVWIVYAILSLIIAQQIVKAIFSVPLESLSEQADVDYLFPVPMQGHVFYTAKYLRSIPRRFMLFFYIILAFQPILWYFGMNFGLTLGMFVLFVFITFLLAEIGSVATHGLYSLRKFVSQPRHQHRIYQIIFFVALTIGTVLLLSPVWLVNGGLVPSPIYCLAYMLVSILFSGTLPGSEGSFTYLYYPAIPWVILGLILALAAILFLTRWLTDKTTVDLYEEIADIARSKGKPRGALSQLPISFSAAKTPIRALFKKDFITGLRKQGKTFYLIGIVGNFVFSLVFVSLIPLFGFTIPVPPEFTSFPEMIYAIILVVIVPLLAISSSDPFQGEYNTIYLLRLAPVAPFRLTFIKYLQFLVTPLCLATSFALYFAAILGSLHVLPVALAILPHAILIATAIGVGLGSRYPVASRAKNEKPLALVITFPFISWVAIIPVLLFQLGFLPGGVTLMLFGSLLITPYTICLVLILLLWASHSYIRQE